MRPAFKSCNESSKSRRLRDRWMATPPDLMHESMTLARARGPFPDGFGPRGGPGRRRPCLACPRKHERRRLPCESDPRDRSRHRERDHAVQRASSRRRHRRPQTTAWPWLSRDWAMVLNLGAPLLGSVIPKRVPVLSSSCAQGLHMVSNRSPTARGIIDPGGVCDIGIFNNPAVFGVLRVSRERVPRPTRRESWANTREPSQT